LVPGVEVAPSVIESPNATIAAEASGASTSTPEMNIQAVEVAAPGNSTTDVESPALMYAVRRAIECLVAGPVSSGRYTLMARSASAGISRSTGSLSALAPGGILIDGFPANVNTRSDPSTIADSWAWRATCAAPMVTADPPNAFDSCTRSRRPPMLARTNMRSVFDCCSW